MPTLEEIHRHVDRAAGDDPREALIGVRKLLDEDLPWLERRAVQRARLELWNWARISRLLARSRQAVRQRFEGIESLPAPDFETTDEYALMQAAVEAYLRGRDARAAAKTTAQIEAESGERGPGEKVPEMTI